MIRESIGLVGLGLRFAVSVCDTDGFFPLINGMSLIYVFAAGHEITVVCGSTTLRRVPSRWRNGGTRGVVQCPTSL